MTRLRPGLLKFLTEIDYRRHEALPRMTARRWANLRAMCEARVPGAYEIDVLAQPELAEEERVLATPTVLRLRLARRAR